MNPSGHKDYFAQAESQPMTISSNLLLHRGMLEQLPGRIHIGKVLVSAVQELKSRLKKDAEEILLFDRGNLEAATQAERFVSHLGSVRTYGFTSDLLLEKLLDSPPIPRIIAAVASEKPFFQK